MCAGAAGPPAGGAALVPWAGSGPVPWAVGGLGGGLVVLALLFAPFLAVPLALPLALRLPFFEVPLAGVAAGAWFGSVPLVDGGTQEMELPAGTQPGSVFRIPREGMPRLRRRGRGDLLVEVEVVVPTQVSAEEEDLLRRLAEIRAEKPEGSKRRRRKAR